MTDYSYGNFSSGFTQSAANNSTLQVINQFKFLAARSIRTSTIILATFNTISAFATALGIFYDCYTCAKREQTSRQRRPLFFRCVRSQDTFPFFLSLGISIQGVIFAVAQSRGLDSIFEAGCSLISQFMWPAIFIAPYIQLVFGLEVTLRAFRTRPFPRRGKWDVAICLAVIKMLLLVTGLVAFFVPAPDFCFASLFWFVANWAEAGFILFLLIAVILAACAGAIFWKLTRHTTIEDDERITASRMVYYLVLAVISNAFMMPFFIFLTFFKFSDANGATGTTLSMISTVVANVSGLLTGGLYLFLRSKTITTIAPRDKLGEYDRRRMKYQIRLRKPGELENESHLLQPVAGSPRLQRQDSQASLVSHEKLEEGTLGSGSSVLWPPPGYSSPKPNPLRSNAVVPGEVMPRAPEPAQKNTNRSYPHSRKQSATYSLIPGKTGATTTSVALLPSTTYSPNSNLGAQGLNSLYDFNDTLRPPPSMATLAGRHKRDSSMASSGTVQIGFRFSNVEDMPPLASKTEEDLGEVFTLECPDALPATGSRPPAVRKESPIEIPSPSIRMPQASTPSPTVSLQNLKTKTLPPVPRPHAVTEAKRLESERTLSPTVYSPQSPTKVKLPSPRGVGFNLPKRSNTSPVQGTIAPPPARTRGNSDATEGRSDWI